MLGDARSKGVKIAMVRVGRRGLRCARTVLAVTVGLVFGASAFGADRVWIIGGGPSLLDSQAQIEQNLKWARDVILRKLPKADVRIYFNGGLDTSKDVVEWQHPPESSASLQPLARVFGAEFQNGQRYYRNTVPGIDGGTRVGNLVSRLHDEFAQIKENDRALFIFEGHGNHDSSDASGNALRLWGDTQLTARDLGKLLAEINPRAQVRLFLPQCFAGGFARTIYAMTTEPRASRGHNMCGFMAVATDKLSEGCSSSVDVGGYRDYTTYFFAALDGHTRLGKKLPSNPDLDGNGTVTLREAHLYSLVNGESTDVPRATSEVYLEDWEPWYRRWLTVAPTTDNIYRKLLVQLAAKNDLPAEDGRLLREAKRMLKELTDAAAVLTKEQEELKKDTKALQARISADVLARWPEARFPYTNNYRTFMLNDVNAAQRFITQDSEYAKLVAMQERDMKLDAEILAKNRKAAQFEKILRISRLAELLDKFERFASDEDRAAYEKLVACEDSAL